MTPRERVKCAFDHRQPDCAPCDYFGTPEIQAALCNHYGVEDEDSLRDALNVDIRYVNPPYTGPDLPEYTDGSTMDMWGIQRKPMPNEYGDYAEPVNLPYAAWTSVEEAESFPWPSPDWFDYDAIPVLCDRYGDLALATGSFGVQDFINGVAFGRGVEQVMMDIAVRDPVYLYIVEKRQNFFMEHVDRILTAAAGRIDFVLCGDDFGTQRDVLISPETFDELFAEKKKALFDMVHTHGAKISHHCCGSSYRLIPRFIEIGMDGIQTIQPRAWKMNPYDLKQEFGTTLTMHGAVDVQGWLQRSTPGEIRAEVHRLMEEAGEDGGYILSPSHNIQPDTPLENVLAVYGAAEEHRSRRSGGAR